MNLVRQSLIKLGRDAYYIISILKANLHDEKVSLVCMCVCMWGTLVVAAVTVKTAGVVSKRGEQMRTEPALTAILSVR